MIRYPSLRFRYPLMAAAVLLAAAAGGCGHSTTTVRGKVTYQGTPLTMGSVIFMSEDGQLIARAAIQPDGTYEIPKAPTGKVKVGVSNPPPAGWGGQPPSGPPNDPETRQAAALAAKYVPSPDSYTNPDKSGLTYEVPSSGKTIDIDLKGPLPIVRGGGRTTIESAD